ncbi:hypothetical protein DOTSEDRAFT_68370 [Dothistroma septosporum NZE10]|uniref:Uncharacterized protein n=1 Tax=Dothistroma septosporum (strain NZE10 / CBS 128990) TaxID=675120 RepID=N1Q488_DOTSN|nr:hypothetical protein DOTSEDRAFT_68370 [Dothistroma septosporum NZE10]
MLDENLPAFFLKPSSTGIKHHRDVLLSHHGSDPAPTYALHNADPASPLPAHKNCYAVALFDAYNPEVLFGEVLARPTWTQPSLSAEELRRNGGIPPPPQPILPNEFVIQLYNPDQQIRIEIREGKWGASDTYEFSMPQSTFRTPSASNLDRGQSDPASLAITPKLFFSWRKESKLSKDLTCFMTGTSVDRQTKKKSKRDPDIAVALWRQMRELTVYEPNVQRLELEDPKGLEVVMLLSAIVVKDLCFASRDNLRDVFNISDTPNVRKLSGGGRKLCNAQNTVSIVGAPNPLGHHPLAQPQSSGRRTDAQRNPLPRLQTGPAHPATASNAPVAADPRAQWEIDAETARLRAHAEAEAKEERRRRRDRERAEEAERKRLQRMVEEEERTARRKQADIEKETERLRKEYGVQPLPSQLQPAPPNDGNARQRLYMQPLPQGSRVNFGAQAQPPRPVRGSNGLYVQNSASSSAVMMSGANNAAASSITLNVPGSKPKPKKSFFGLRSLSDDAVDRKKLNKKSSTMWD